MASEHRKTSQAAGPHAYLTELEGAHKKLE